MLASEANQSMYDILTGGIGGDMKLILKSGKVPPKLTTGVINLRRWTVSSQSYCVRIITYLKESFSKLNVLVYGGFRLFKKSDSGL